CRSSARAFRRSLCRTRRCLSAADSAGLLRGNEASVNRAVSFHQSLKRAVMIIDAHQHFWHYDPVRLDWIGPDMAELKRDWLPPDLAPRLCANGVDKTIAVQATSGNSETEFLLQQAAAHDWIAGVVGWADLRAQHVGQRLTQWQ